MKGGKWGLSPFPSGFEKFPVAKGIAAVDAGRISNYLGTQEVWDNLVKEAADAYTH